MIETRGNGHRAEEAVSTPGSGPAALAGWRAGKAVLTPASLHIPAIPLRATVVCPQLPTGHLAPSLAPLHSTLDGDTLGVSASPWDEVRTLRYNSKDRLPVHDFFPPTPISSSPAAQDPQGI